MNALKLIVLQVYTYCTHIILHHTVVNSKITTRYLYEIISISSDLSNYENQFPLYKSYIIMFELTILECQIFKSF